MLERSLTAGGGVGEMGEGRVEVVPLVLGEAQSRLLHRHQLLLRLEVLLSSDQVLAKHVLLQGSPFQSRILRLNLLWGNTCSAGTIWFKDLLIWCLTNILIVAFKLTLSVVDIIDAPTVVQDLLPTHLNI